MYTQKIQKLCGSKLYTSTNCHNKIRKTSQNKFEIITLMGKHAFKYTVITQNKTNKEVKVVTFNNRKEALCFFMVAVKKYD